MLSAAYRSLAGADNMAAVNFSAVTVLKNCRRNTVYFSYSSTSVSFPSNSGRRNHLRLKILKTLTKPHPSSTPVPSPPEQLYRLDRPEEVVRKVDDDVDARVDEVVLEDEGIEGVKCDVEVLRSEIGSEMVGVDRFVRKLDMKVVGMYGLGLFVLQAVCGLLIFGSAGVPRDDENDVYKSESDDLKEKVVLEDDVRVRRIVAKASEVVNVDQLVLEERIREIRAMARNAREREAKEGRGKSDVEGLGEEDDDEVDGIEKEVSTRLARLQKKLGSVSDKSPVSLVNKLSKVKSASGNSEEVDEKLVFPKKQTFRNSITTKPMSDVKGFSNVTDHTNSLVDKKEVLIDPNLTSPPVVDGNSSINDFVSLKENVDKKLIRRKALELKRRRGSKQKEAKLVETKAGDVQGISNRKHSGTSNTSPVMRASQQEIVVNNQNGALNGSSKNGGKSTTGRMERKKELDNKADLWWFQIPYVFAILMRQGSSPAGLYTFKAKAKALNNKDEAYTVAFEDRSDANNFCYIVESFFEETSNFTADIVPLPTKEMHEPLESGVLHVIIVKKGQLELYAGQPLAEVETRLRSLVQ